MFRLVAMLAVAALLPLLAPSSGRVRADDDARSRGLRALHSMTGCFLVDYSYAETESLRAGYVVDRRVYDVNREKSVKEWISADVLSPRRLWLQRILFFTDLRGQVRADTMIAHQAEDWEYQAPFRYDFVGPGTWQVKRLDPTPGLWTRRVTNLDDGLRYQCAAVWAEDTAYLEWSCSNYAPIPGRETRDMGRKDYHALDRTTRLVIYGESWLERQDNVKIVHDNAGRTPLAREVGKNWYVKLPESECAAARAFAKPRQAFWSLLRETWDGILDAKGPFVEKTPAGQPPRFVLIHEIEEDVLDQDLSDPARRHAVRERILKVIEEYRQR